MARQVKEKEVTIHNVNVTETLKDFNLKELANLASYINAKIATKVEAIEELKKVL